MVRRFLRQKFATAAPSCCWSLLAGCRACSSPAPAASGRARRGAYVALLLIASRRPSVSRDASTGALQMILARPIRRTEYLFGRYLGIVVAFAAFSLACVLLGLFANVVLGLPGPVAPLELLGASDSPRSGRRAAGGPGRVLLLFLHVPAGLRGRRSASCFSSGLRLAPHATWPWMSEASEAIGRGESAPGRRLGGVLPGTSPTPWQPLGAPSSRSRSFFVRPPSSSREGSSRMDATEAAARRRGPSRRSRRCCSGCCSPPSCCAS